jgi:hypothetical protein
MGQRPMLLKELFGKSEHLRTDKVVGKPSGLLLPKGKSAFHLR